jgi:hypothetical protein
MTIRCAFHEARPLLPMQISPVLWRYLLVTLAAFAAGCAVPSKEDAYQLGVNAASCIQRNARQLDDRISPADTIAIGIMSRCQEEINAYDQVRLPNRATAFGSGAWAGRSVGWMRQITSIVLQTRAESR